MSEEIWEIVPSANDFEVSNFGQIRNAKDKTICQQDIINGYKYIKINGKIRYSHRLVMEAFCGQSDEHVDHINNMKCDNKLSNLQYLNNRNNMSKYHKEKGKSGLNITKRGKFKAQVYHEKKNLHLGYFFTKQEAINVCEKFKQNREELAVK